MVKTQQRRAIARWTVHVIYLLNITEMTQIKSKPVVFRYFKASLGTIFLSQMVKARTSCYLMLIELRCN